jgi:hypothetical protein
MNSSARFCVKCGANLELSAATETPNYTNPNHPPVQSNVQLQQVKQISMQYFSYFIEVLKSPVRAGQTSNAGHVVNAFITLGLFALLLPLIVYFYLRSTIVDINFLGFETHVSFGRVVIKSFFILALIVLASNSVLFLVLKLGKAGVKYREVLARFGTFMVPSVALFVVALLFSLVGAHSVMGIFITAGLFAWLAASGFVIYSFKKDHTSGLDAFYGVLITYLATLLLLYLFGDAILSNLIGGIDPSFKF